MNEDLLKIEKLAEDVLRLSRNTLAINMRFLDLAIAELNPQSTNKVSFATDGKYLYYNPIYILKRYSTEHYIVTRDYLHTLLHCLYRHNFVNELLNPNIWDLACDIAVENIINELDMTSIYAARANKQNDIISLMKKELKHLTAEKIYRYYLDKKINDDEIRKIRALFFADDHSIWYLPDDLLPGSNHTAGGDHSNEREETSLNNGGGESNDDSSLDQSNNEGKSGNKELEERWKEISERMLQDLETFSKERGDRAGSMMQNLREVNREKYDYTTFLKKFAVMGEAMKINDDEFDYVFYTYGLKLYKKMPLIEPLEYKDVKRIREFAIIIDTSGSVSGELVQTFINKTYNILKNTESFFSKINLYIIQCDAKIQEVVKITSQKEFDDYIKNMKLHGFGGTDFRPAFGLVNELVKSGELTRLKGVIYFTDGWGIFPEKKPIYDAAFVFIRQDDFNPNVPPWAIKLVLDKEDI